MNKEKMNTDKENWIDDVLNSMNNSQKAQPNPDLFSKIEQKITDSRPQVIQMNLWIRYAAAVSVILFANIAVVLSYNQNKKLPMVDVVETHAYNEPLITSFKIYDE